MLVHVGHGGSGSGGVALSLSLLAWLQERLEAHDREQDCVALEVGVEISLD